MLECSHCVKHVRMMFLSDFWGVDVGVKLVYTRYDNPYTPAAGGSDNHQSEFACIYEGVGVL